MRGERGFMLLEVLVAFAIAAIAMAALVEGAAVGLGTASVAGRYEEAIARARSLLAAAGAHLVPADNQGDDGGGFHWHVRITPLAAAVIGADSAAGRPAASATLYRVGVAVSWSEDHRTRSVQLDSERIWFSTGAPGR
jgi:general secretion pathway protein I